MTDMFDLNGKVAVITGGSRGIGRMIAEEFVRRGVRTYITARKAEPCIQTAKELSEFGECIALPQDLSTLDGIEAFANELGERESSLDILINNAGAAWGAEFDEFPESGWDKVMDINVKSPFFLTQKLAPMLRAAASAESAWPRSLTGRLKVASSASPWNWVTTPWLASMGRTTAEKYSLSILTT